MLESSRRLFGDKPGLAVDRSNHRQEYGTGKISELGRSWTSFSAAPIAFAGTGEKTILLPLRLVPKLGIALENFLGDLGVDKVDDVDGFADAEVECKAGQRVRIGGGHALFCLEKIHRFLQSDPRRDIQIDVQTGGQIICRRLDTRLLDGLVLVQNKLQRRFERDLDRAAVHFAVTLHGVAAAGKKLAAFVKHRAKKRRQNTAT